MTDESPRLYLITPPVSDAMQFAPLLEAAVGAADIACVLLRTAARDESGAKAIIRILAPIAQARGAALLVENDPRLAVRADADGVHIDSPQDPARLAEAIEALQPKKIVGAGGLADRDAAMVAGEAGVDYLMFGGPDAADGASHEEISERIAWWASIFNVPCVGYARHPDDAGEIADAGAEFVALCDGLWDNPAGVETTLRSVARAILRTTETIA